MIKHTFFIVALFCTTLATAEIDISNDHEWWDDWKDDIVATWRSDRYELIVPMYTWHNRFTYSHEKIETYNELPWGAGFGKYHIDTSGNKHELYALVFSDSHSKPEPMIGYAWQKNWYLDDDKDFIFGLGVTFFITARDDYNWIPFPAALPTLAFEYKRFVVQTTYIPGFGGNTGNVLFTMCKWLF